MKRTLQLIVFTVFVAPQAHAEPTLELRVAGPEEVFPGDPETTSLTAQGEITLGPKVRQLRDIKHTIVALAASGDTLYAATAEGEIYGAADKPIVDRKDQVITALLATDDALIFGGSPNGGLHRIVEGRTETLAEKPGTYVWGVARYGKSFLIATGEPGTVSKVGPDGEVERLFESSETHIRSLAYDAGVGIVAGGGNKGILYRVQPDGRPFALYDSGLHETTAIEIDGVTGDIYASFVSESQEGKFVPGKSIGTVDREGDSKAAPITGSEVVRVRKNGRVDVLFTSRTEGALALHFDRKRKTLAIVTGAGPKGRGRVYEVATTDRDTLRLAARLESSLPTTTATQRGGLVVGTADGRIFGVSSALRKEGVYVSAEQPLRGIARVGRVWFDADTPRGGRVGLAIRTGNSERADETWSDWSDAIDDKDGGPVSVPRGRFAQFRVRLSGGAPLVRSLHASVKRMNRAPEIREIFLLDPGLRLTEVPSVVQQQKVVTLAKNTLDQLRGPSQKRPATRVRQAREPGWRTVAWKAVDPNKDRLLYGAQIKAVDGLGSWRTLTENTELTFHSFDSRMLSDGRYVVRVVANDRPQNAPDVTLEDERVSLPFLVDNTPPVISRFKAELDDGFLRVHARAEDLGSELGVAHISIDGGPWLLMPPQDGLLDAKQESFRLRVSTEAKNAPINVAFAINDIAGNRTVRATTAR